MRELENEKKIGMHSKREPTHRKMWKKQNNAFIKSRMEEIQKVQRAITVEEIKEHQKLYADLKEKVLHNNDKSGSTNMYKFLIFIKAFNEGLSQFL